MTFPLAISQANAPDNRMRIGTVSSVNPFTVNVQGENVVNPGIIDRSRGFVIGDVVALLRQDQTWLVLGLVWGSSFPQYQSGYTSCAVVAATSVVVSVAFARPFSAPPAVAGSITSAPGATSGWQSRFINITVNGFQIFLFGTASTFTVDVGWIATERTQ